MPNINIYIPSKYEKILESKALEEESLGLAAKRLLLAILDGEIEPPPPVPPATPTTVATDEIKELRDKVAALEGKLTRYFLDDDSASGEVVPVLAERVAALETLLEERWYSLTDTNETVKEYSDVAIDRIIELEKKVEPIAIFYQEKLPMAKSAELEERLTGLEDLLGRLVDGLPEWETVIEGLDELEERVKTIEANSNDSGNVSEKLREIRELLKKSEADSYSHFMGKIKVIEEQLDYVTDLPQRIETMGAVLDSFEEKLEDLSRETEQPKRRGRPRKEAE